MTSTVVEEFERFGMTFQCLEVADEMAALCLIYQMSAEDIVMKFLGYVGARPKLKGDVLTLDMVKLFGSRCLEKLKSEVVVYASPAPKPKQAVGMGTHGSGFKTPLSNRSAQTERVTASASGKVAKGITEEEALMVGGLSFDENGSHSAQKTSVSYHQRTNSGDIVNSYGSLPKGKRWDKLRQSERGIVQVFPQDHSVYLQDIYPYMFVHYQEVAVALTNSIDDLGMKIAATGKIAEYSSPTVIGSIEQVYTLGRLLPNEESGLSEHHLVLQTSSTLHKGVISQLDIGLVKECHLFPGQIVAVKGHGNGRAFVASELLTGSLPAEVPIKKPELDSLHIMVACGPYHIKDHSDPEPLFDFINSMDSAVPDVVILMGPFVDEKLVESQSFIAADSGTIDSYFRSLMKCLFDEIVTKRDIHLILVPSASQLIDFPVYPVPGFKPETCIFDMGIYSDPAFKQKVTFAPEPSLLNINGVVVGITSTDIIMHLKKRELTRGNSEGLAARLVGHLLLQQSFYPLYPPEIPADISALCRHAKISQRPHLLITPSSLVGFAKNVHGTVCVNPERLSKGQSGGSYARIYIQLSEIGAQKDAGIKQFADVTCAQVVRI